MSASGDRQSRAAEGDLKRVDEGGVWVYPALSGMEVGANEKRDGDARGGQRRIVKHDSTKWLCRLMHLSVLHCVDRCYIVANKEKLRLTRHPYH